MHESLLLAVAAAPVTVATRPSGVMGISSPDTRAPRLTHTAMHQIAPPRQAQHALAALTAIAACAGLTAFIDVRRSPDKPEASVAPGPVVVAPAGAVRGSAEGDLSVFRGIPYAQPRGQARHLAAAGLPTALGTIQTTIKR